MKIKIMLCFVLTAGLLAGCTSSKSSAPAKISRGEAEKIALARVPNGTIKEGELEKENGKLQWSFDMVTPDTKVITEVNVDAVTGGIISIGKE
jgi:uncharacterized membrane protein YkoI